MNNRIRLSIIIVYIRKSLFIAGLFVNFSLDFIKLMWYCIYCKEVFKINME